MFVVRLPKDTIFARQIADATCGGGIYRCQKNALTRDVIKVEGRRHSNNWYCDEEGSALTRLNRNK